MALPAAEIIMENDVTEDVDDITRSRGQDDREERLLMVDPVHLGKDRDACGAEDDGHDLGKISILVICNTWSAMGYPDANKLLVQNDPGEKVNKRGIRSKQGGDHRAVKDPIILICS